MGSQNIVFVSLSIGWFIFQPGRHTKKRTYAVAYVQYFAWAQSAVNHIYISDNGLNIVYDALVSVWRHADSYQNHSKNRQVCLSNLVSHVWVRVWSGVKVSSLSNEDWNLLSQCSFGCDNNTRRCWRLMTTSSVGILGGCMWTASIAALVSWMRGDVTNLFWARRVVVVASTRIAPK